MSPNAKQQITKKLAKKPVVAAKTAAAKPKGPPVTAAQSLAQKKAAVAKVTKLAADSKKIAKLAAKPKPKTTKAIDSGTMAPERRQMGLFLGKRNFCVGLGVRPWHGKFLKLSQKCTAHFQGCLQKN